MKTGNKTLNPAAVNGSRQTGSGGGVHSQFF